MQCKLLYLVSGSITKTDSAYIFGMSSINTWTININIDEHCCTCISSKQVNNGTMQKYNF